MYAIESLNEQGFRVRVSWGMGGASITSLFRFFEGSYRVVLKKPTVTVSLFLYARHWMKTTP